MKMFFNGISAKWLVIDIIITVFIFVGIYIYSNKFSGESIYKYDSIYTERDKDIEKIGYKELIKNKDKYVIIDIRNQYEFENGYIPGSINYFLGDLAFDNNFLDKIKQLVNENKKIVFVCADGDQSEELVTLYKKKYGLTISMMSGGLSDIKDYFRGGGLGFIPDPNVWTGDFDLNFNYENQFKIIDKSEIKSEFLVNLSYDINNEFKYKMRNYTCNYNTKDEILSKSIYAPIRNMPTVEITNLLNKIGSGSVTSVCYTRASCSYSKLLGYLVTKQGGKFDGIYIIEESNCIDKINDPKNKFINNLTLESERRKRGYY